ncbi:MAG TPA: hypothetical protein VG147_04125 [Solirubrobacteraceae bacterium]|nr:hypothetical protein [Solirubrobacteraceae bacterium]
MGAEVEAFLDEGFRIDFDAVGFDLNRIALALFSSTYRSPIPLLFGRERVIGDTLSSDIAMTVELAHAMYGINEDDEPTAAAKETPEWYLRGMASFTDREGIPRSVPMHVFLSAPEGSLERATVHIVCDPKLYTVRE